MVCLQMRLKRNCHIFGNHIHVNRFKGMEREREVVRGQLAREKETHETLLRQFDAQLHESTTVKAEVETLVQRLAARVIG